MMKRYSTDIKSNEIPRVLARKSPKSDCRIFVVVVFNIFNSGQLSSGMILQVPSDGRGISARQIESKHMGCNFQA